MLRNRQVGEMLIPVGLLPHEEFTRHVRKQVIQVWETRGRRFKSSRSDQNIK
jgi:hypothetical protein